MAFCPLLRFVFCPFVSHLGSITGFLVKGAQYILSKKIAQIVVLTNLSEYRKWVQNGERRTVRTFSSETRITSMDKRWSAPETGARHPLLDGFFKKAQ